MQAVFHLPTKIHAGQGSHTILPLLLEGHRVLIVTDSGIAASPVLPMVQTVLLDAGVDAGLYTDIQTNPDQSTVERLTTFIRCSGIDQIVALGGGSPIDAAKAAAALATNPGTLDAYQWEGRSFEQKPLPLIAVPTTAGTGSEVTGVSVITSRNIKKGILGEAIFPRAAIVDPLLMTGMPLFLTASTGLDALTHAIEAYIGRNANPITDSMALEAIRLIARYLLKAGRNGDDLEAREGMAVASTLAGIAMDQAGLGIVHSLSSPVCAYLHQSHGFANAMLLPFGLEFNLTAAEEKLAALAQLLEPAGATGAARAGTGEQDRETLARSAISAVRRLITALGLDEQIAHVRSERVNIPLFAADAAKMFLIRNNPRSAGEAECREIFSEIFRIS
jgi:alcohol dehydrogenase class IV